MREGSGRGLCCGLVFPVADPRFQFIGGYSKCAPSGARRDIFGVFCVKNQILGAAGYAPL